VKGKLGSRVAESLATLFVLCLGLRLAMWIIEPLLPLLIVLGVVVAVLLIATSRS
jgi:CHASE2 domain-containing sensor protein